MFTLGDGAIEKIGEVYPADRLLPATDRILHAVRKTWPRGFGSGSRIRLALERENGNPAEWALGIDGPDYEFLSQNPVTTILPRKYGRLLLIAQFSAGLGWHVDPERPHIRLMTNLDDRDATVLVATEWDHDRQGWLNPGMNTPTAHTELTIEPGNSYIVDNTPLMLGKHRTPHAVPVCSRLMLQTSIVV